MVPLSALIVPIVVAAVLVHLASALIHMVIQWHRHDYRRLPDEEAVRAALRKSPPAPGQYMVPHHAGMKEMQSPEMKKKFEEGPVAMITIRAPGPVTMGKELGLWFLFCLLMATTGAYIAGRTLAPGADYLQVFRVAGTVAFAGFGMGSIQQSIWMGRPWSSTARDLADALLYGCLIGGALGWRWPHAM